MKFLIPLALFLSQAAYADDFFTPQQIKKDINADVFANPTGFAMGYGYVNGVINSIKTIQNLNLVSREICLNGPYDAKAALNAMNISSFPATNEGGTMFIYSALLAKYHC